LQRLASWLKEGLDVMGPVDVYSETCETAPNILENLYIYIVPPIYI
jgi:hypothetical protein